MSLKLIEGIVEQADAAHAQTVKSADEARLSTYNAALAAAGIEVEPLAGSHFEGDASQALMHWRGVGAFKPEVFRPVAQLLERIESAGRFRPEDDSAEEDQEPNRVPVMSAIYDGPADLDEFPYDRSPQTSLSLVEVTDEPLGLIAATRQVGGIITRDGEEVTVTERQLGLPALTAITGVNINSRTATLEDELVRVHIGDRLVLHGEQHAPGIKGRSGGHPDAGFHDNTVTRLESYAPMAVGWDEIRSTLMRLARNHIIGPHSDGVDNSAIEKPGLSPKQQKEVLYSLLTGLRLESEFSESEAVKAAATIRALEELANPAQA